MFLGFEYHPIRYFIILVFLISYSTGLHLRGSWNTRNFFKFLAKFGFQETNMHDRSNTQGYIYGNITSTQNVSHSLSFVVVDSEYFLDYYGNRSVHPRTKACPAMFSKINTIAWDQTCNPDGKEDFLRHIPCPKGQLCVDEDNPKWLISGSQFTYRVQDTSQPRFWYISMVACHHDTTNQSNCLWNPEEQNDVTIDYDIWLVNGDPDKKHINPFEHQFSFENHDIFEMYLAFFIVYSFLVPIQLYALTKQKHMLPMILSTSMGMEFVGIIFNFIHVFKFAFDGYGVDLLKVTGNFIDMVAQCLFMLLLLLIVKGWTITRMTLSWRARAVLFTVWGTYTVANLALFIWNQMEIDLISNLDEWQTWPGWLILMFRIAIMAWFLVELRKTFVLEHNNDKTRFYLHFGAGFLVWFVYLPIVTVICTQVSALWKYKTILSVSYSADFLSYCVMVHLLWPSRSYLYFNLKMETRIPMDELEFADLARDNDSSDDLVEYHESASLIKENYADGIYKKRNGHLPWNPSEDGLALRENKVVVTEALIESIPGRIGALRTDSLDESVASATINAHALDDSDDEVFNSIKSTKGVTNFFINPYEREYEDEANTSLINGIAGSNVVDDEYAPIVQL